MKHRMSLLLEVEVDFDVDDDVELADIMGDLYDEVFKVQIKLDNGAEFDGEIADWHVLSYEENVKDED